MRAAPGGPRFRTWVDDLSAWTDHRAEPPAPRALVAVAAQAAADLEYVPLPNNVKDLVRKQWANIKDASGKTVSYK